MEVGINLKVNGVTYGPIVAVSVEMSGNGTGVELSVEVEVVADRENLLKRGSEASGLSLAGFRDLFPGAVFGGAVFGGAVFGGAVFGGAGFAEARMSAELLGVGCIVESKR